MARFPAVATLSVLAWCAVGARADFAIVGGGVAKATLVTPDNPTEAEALAAERLQYYIGRMTGVKLPIVRESAAPKGSLLFIGNTNAGSAFLKKLKEKQPPEEASLVAGTRNRAYVVGIDDPGVVHATYFLLEDIGCRWYFPTEWGMVLPKLSEVHLPEGETYRAPAFAIRAGLPGFTLNRDKDPAWTTAEWGRGNHLGGWTWWGAGHSYQYLVDFNQFKAHPEWFAYYNGARHPTQLCTTNPEVRQAALNTVLTVLKDPHAPRLICISPCDGSGFCECENCQKFIPTKPDGTKEVGNSIDRIVEFANFIADSLRDKHPDHYVTYYCDYHSVGTPTLVTPAKNTVFWIVQWAQDQFHGVSPDTRMGQSLERWCKLGNPIYLYTYYGSYGSFTFWPQVHAIRNDIPYYKRKGAIGLYSETHAHWGTQHLNFIVFPRLLWDANTNVDALIDDFCDKFYGPAARVMRKYYDLLEQTGKYGPAQYHLHSDIVAAFGPGVLERLRELIGQAQKALEGADPVYQQRMKFVSDGFRLADLYLSANHLKYDYGRTKDPTLRQKMVEMCKEALTLVTSPQYANRLTENWLSEQTLKQDLESLEKGTSFGVGKFSYSDYYVRGGRTALDTVKKSGFIDGTWGLDMDAGVQGELLYRIQARDGVFSSAYLTSLVFGSNLIGIRVEVGATPEGPWQVVAAHEAPTVEKPSGVTMPVDLSPHIKGKQEFFLRLVATNKGGGYVCGLCNFRIEGEVVAKP